MIKPLVNNVNTILHSSYIGEKLQDTIKQQSYSFVKMWKPFYPLYQRSIQEFHTAPPLPPLFPIRHLQDPLPLVEHASA